MSLKDEWKVLPSIETYQLEKELNAHQKKGWKVFSLHQTEFSNGTLLRQAYDVVLFRSATTADFVENTDKPF